MSCPGISDACKIILMIFPISYNFIAFQHQPVIRGIFFLKKIVIHPYQFTKFNIYKIGKHKLPLLVRKFPKHLSICRMKFLFIAALLIESIGK